MYVTTFYSFKGGVGRTMALANVAVELAQSGRRVLMVDFDLEAPGLDTLALPKPSGTHAGIVDYVSDYVTSSESPDVSNYIYEVTGVGRQEGRLYVMPAGKRDNEYAQRFNGIDWANLYAEHDGYLMFEDLKAQWKAFLAPDYVLIDSRTGHTDVSGICTRHLPDSVLIFFIPNEQNLRGLERIVPEIREEATSGRHKEIELLFVMSNVPDLDDEEEILADRRKQFAESLKINEREQLQIIHRYDSLHLLNQAIFTKDKPKSRLAHEYQRLTRRLMSMNPEDKEGALDFIRQLRTRRTSVPPAEAEKRVVMIDERHPNDAAIRMELASLRKEQGRWIEALRLIEELIRIGHPASETLLERAELRINLGDSEGVAADALRVLRDPSLDYYKVDRVIRILRATNELTLLEIGRLPGIASQAPELRVWIAQQLRRTQTELRAGLEVLRSVVADSGVTEAQARVARSEIAFNLIGLHDAPAALKHIAENAATSQDASVNDRFNAAMALWAIEGVPSREAFARVLSDVLVDDPSSRSANRLQCYAVVQWVLGRSEDATQLLHRARNAATLKQGNHITCWQYLDVPTEAFLDDINQFFALIDGKQILPAVVRSVEHRPVSSFV